MSLGKTLMNLKRAIHILLLIMIILTGSSCDQISSQKTEQKTTRTSGSKEIQPYEYFGISAQDFIQRLETNGIKQKELVLVDTAFKGLSDRKINYMFKINKMKDIKLESDIGVSLIGNLDSTDNLTEVSLNFRIVDVESPIVRAILKTTIDIATQDEEESNEIIDEVVEQYRPYIKNGFTSKKIEERIRINGYSIFYTTFQSVIGFRVTKES